MAGFVTPTETYLRDRIHFARIFGEPQAFGLLGRQDYVFMEHVAEANGLHTFRMRVWKNIGAGSTKLEGMRTSLILGRSGYTDISFLADGNKYCNMKGYSDGRMDYVWTLSTGNSTYLESRSLSLFLWALSASQVPLTDTNSK